MHGDLLRGAHGGKGTTGPHPNGLRPVLNRSRYELTPIAGDPCLEVILSELSQSKERLLAIVAAKVDAETPNLLSEYP